MNTFDLDSFFPKDKLQLIKVEQTVNALLGCHDLALSCCHEIARISVMECSL